MILDPRLENDSAFVTDLELCQVRLHHNAAFPWIILIPKKAGLVEIIDLSLTDQQALLGEINKASLVMKTLYKPDKLNIANLGNVVPQLHIHVIARFKSDKAWPKPIWNTGVSEEYSPSNLNDSIAALRNAFLSVTP